jgi:hypothetical protein
MRRAHGQTARPGLFGGIAAGFLGAGLFGLLFGQEHGGLRLDHRSAVASHAGRDRRPADLRLMAAAQYASAGLCGGDWTQLWRSRWNVGRHQCDTGRRTPYHCQVGL